MNPNQFPNPQYFQDPQNQNVFNQYLLKQQQLQSAFLAQHTQNQSNIFQNTTVLFPQNPIFPQISSFISQNIDVPLSANSAEVLQNSQTQSQQFPFGVAPQNPLQLMNANIESSLLNPTKPQPAEQQDSNIIPTKEEYQQSADRSSQNSDEYPKNDAMSNDEENKSGYDGQSPNLSQEWSDKQASIDKLYASIQQRCRLSSQKLTKYALQLCLEKFSPQQIEDSIYDYCQKENFKNKPFSFEEDQLIIDSINKYGRDWDKITSEFEGRTKIVLKNRYYYLNKTGIVDRSTNDWVYGKGQYHERVQKKKNKKKKKTGRQSMYKSKKKVKTGEDELSEAE